MNKALLERIAITFTILIAHILVIFLILTSLRLSDLNKELYSSIIIIFLTLVLIIDIFMISGSYFRDRLLRIIALLLSIAIILLSSVAIYYVSRTNRTIAKITQGASANQQEILRIRYITFDNNSINELKDIENKKIGIIPSSSENGLSTLAIKHIKDEGLNVTYKEYPNYSELFLALEHNEIDVAIADSSFSLQLKANGSFEKIIDKFKVIHELDKEISVDTKTSNKDISIDPFSILLIGFAPEPGGGGLADSIILSTFNPQSLSVTMTSVPRDSFVPIACYGGNQKDKLTHARGISRQCLIDSVSNLFDLDIDFYAEINFDGVVELVDAIGGIEINSPVEFIGQNSSTTRGHYTSWIGKGYNFVNGEQALAFARERYAMPNGDFDRQKNQQQVIQNILKKMFEIRDVNKLLNVLDVLGDNFNTNLSLQQMSSLLNYMLGIKNYWGGSSFNLIEFNNYRLYGYSSYTYNYGMQRALWCYPLYEGSIKENRDLILANLDEFDTIKQDKWFKFEYRYLYNYRIENTEVFNERLIHESLPDIVPNLSSMSLQEIISWANSKSITLNIKWILPNDPAYDPQKANSLVSIDSDVREESLLENITSISITAMAPNDGNTGNGDPKIIEEINNKLNSLMASKTKLDVVRNELANYNLIINYQEVSEGENDIISSYEVNYSAENNSYNINLIITKVISNSDVKEEETETVTKPEEEIKEDIPEVIIPEPNKEEEKETEPVIENEASTNVTEDSKEEVSNP